MVAVALQPAQVRMGPSDRFAREALRGDLPQFDLRVIEQQADEFATAIAAATDDRYGNHSD
jgi:hypothetical protein